ncbi:Transcriptional regulator KdgR [Pigmentiphaga humi]|uniref:Transcriptional regulator KdgR n=1 Tax=Pigmentiphaga humi TaxID=2478468 RepID=A0A3P4AYT0_9BURK|nr:DNA-binding transcriptional regulator [Pigmentiphaga humi]VCU68568.1 Transcriptional regulator KdgR [Pigmentiphaga humi]
MTQPPPDGQDDRARAGIRSVERAIELLQALNRQAVSSIDDLYRRTGIPKPTIARLLRTFEAKGLVAQSARFGAYYLASGMASLYCGYNHQPQVIEVARPVCDALTREFKWPVTLALLDVDAMVVRYSTIPQSPLSLLHSSINLRRSLVERALGLAYLAFCDAQEREFILDVVRRSGREEDALAHDRDGLEQLLAATRRQGYALRIPELSEQSCTMAIPVCHRGRIAATLGLTWFSSVMTPAEAVDRYLARLTASANQIASGLGQLNPAPIEAG